MASPGLFGYDPYDDDGGRSYYYASPYRYTYPYYLYNQPAPAPARTAGGGFFPASNHYYGYPASAARTGGGFFPSTAADVGSFHQQPAPVGFFPAAWNVDPAAAVVRPKPGPSASIPLRFVGSDPEPEDDDARVPVRRAGPSAEEAAVRLQAAARGFLARSAVRALREVEREAREVAEKVAREADALRGDARARVAVGEALMRLLLRLDAVRGARGYRRRVTRRVLALQDAVDALEQSERPAEEAEAETTVEEENAVAPEGNTASEMEVMDGCRAAGEPSASESEDAEPEPDVAGLSGGGDKPAGADSEGEWEMVAEEPAAAPPATSPSQPQGPAEVTRRPAAAEAGAGGADGGVDAKRLTEMVAALCEQSAQQCAVIGALAQRVDSLERAVRRFEDAERRRRAKKKLRKQGKGSTQINQCYSD